MQRLFRRFNAPRQVVGSVASPRQRMTATALSSIVLFGFMLVGQAAWAVATSPGATITFHDLTDTISFTTTDTTRVPLSLASCPNPGATTIEECGVSVNPPSANATVTGGSLGMGTGTSNTTFVGIAESSNLRGTASDRLLSELINPAHSNNWFFDFVSDGPADTGLGSCLEFSNSGCALAEDGTIQTLGTIQWSDNTVDTVRFQSDAPEVPEPSSIILVLSGVVGLAGSRARGWSLNRSR